MPAASSLFSLATRTALITGGGSGIGAALANGLAQSGARVVICGRRPERLQETDHQINAALGEVCFPLACDITDLNAAESIVERATGLAGAAPTILINNAGVNVRQPAADLTAEHWRASLDLMLNAPFFLARACTPGMAAAKYGRIVNIASLQSRLAFPNSIP